MNGKEYSIAFALNAKLSNEFGSTFDSAKDSIGSFGSQIARMDQELENIRGLIKARNEVADYQKEVDRLSNEYKENSQESERLKTELADLTKKYKDAKQTLGKFEKQIKKTENPSEELTDAFERQKIIASNLEKEINSVDKKEKDYRKTVDKSKTAVEKSKTALEKKKEALKNLEAQYGSAGVKIDILVEKEKKLALQTEKWNKIAARSSKASATFASGMQKITQGAASLGSIAGSAMGTIGKPLKDSMAMEDAMADLAKVSDLSEKGLADMQKELERMSLSIPMTASGLAQIAAAAAGAGVSSKDLATFTEQAAKMAVAFDMTAEDAGTMMSKWQSGMKLSLPQTFALADAVNGLSNTNAALATDIGDTMQRYGALGKVAGLTETQTAALATSLIASGASSETAATGMKAFMGALAKGGTMSDLQAAAFSNIGFDPKALQASLQKNAPETIVNVLEAINKKIPPEKRTMYLNAMFGETGMEAIGPLLQNLEGLKKNFDMVADAENYAGSMEKEFSARSDTTSNALQLVQNAAASVSRAIGDPLLEPLRELSQLAVKVADNFGSWLKEHPDLVKAAVAVAAGFSAVGAAIAVGNIALGTLMVPLGLAMKTFSGFQKILWGLSNFGFKPLMWTLNAAGKSISALSWVGSAGAKGILSIGSAVGKVGAAFKTAFMSPVGLAIGAVALLAYGAYTLYQNWDEISAYFKEKFPGAMEVASNAISWLGDGVSWLSDKFDAITAFFSETFIPAWKENWNCAVGIAKSIWSGIQSAIDQPIEFVIGKINSFIQKINGFSFENPFTKKKIGFNLPLLGGGAQEKPADSSDLSGSVGEDVPPPEAIKPQTTPVRSAAAERLHAEYPKLRTPVEDMQSSTPSMSTKDLGKSGSPSQAKGSTTVTFAPVINVQGGDSTVEEKIRKALEESQKQFEQKMQLVLDRNARLAY